MKRSDMVGKFVDYFISEASRAGHTIDDDFKEQSLVHATGLLSVAEKNGMAPPLVSQEDRQAIMDVYYAGYTFHQWDEDFEKDEKVQESKRRRAEAKVRREAKVAARLRNRKGTQ